MPRGVPAAILARLNETVIAGGFFYLFDFEFRSGTRYWDRRGHSFGGHDYEPRILSVSQISFTPGDTQEVSVTLDNTDGELTTLDQAESIYGCAVTIRQYVPAAGLAHIVFIGYLDEIQSLGPNEATLAMYSDTPGMRTQVPARTIGFTCRHEFGNADSNALWVSVTEFDGAECSYQRTSSIGFKGTLGATITASATSFAATITTSFKISDQIQIGTEIMLVTGLISGGVEVIRGWRETTAAAHANGATIYFANCQKTTNACTVRGMYGNNALDMFSGSPAIRKRNYFGGLPILNGYSYGKFRTAKAEKPTKQRVAFSGNESAYGKTLPLVYGRCRLANPILLLVNPEGDFLTGFFAICEGTLATNPTDASQTNPYLAFLQDHSTAGGTTSPPRTTSLTVTRPPLGPAVLIPAGYTGGTVLWELWIESGLITVVTYDLVDETGHVYATLAATGVGVHVSTTFVPDLAVGRLYHLQASGVIGVVSSFLRLSASVPTSGYPSAERYIRMNGKGRHDTSTSFTLNFGIQVSTGCQDQIEPGAVFFPNEADFVTSFLGLWGMAWFVLRIDITDAPMVASDGGDVTGMAGIAYGRLVRVYSTTSAYTFKATTNGAWALMDLMASRRSGAGVPYSGFNVQSFLDVASYNDAFVPDTVNAGQYARRWTFNAALDDAKAYDEWAAQIALGMHATRPFRDAAGLYKIKSLKAVGDAGLVGVPVFTDKSDTSRNILWANGNTTLVKFRRRRQNEIPNRIKATFVNWDDFGKVEITIDDEPSQTLTSTRNIVEKNVDLVGCTLLDEAVRSATLILRIGEFGEGGLSNNNGVRFETFVKDSANLEVGDVVAVESHLLDPDTERYFRVTRLDDSPQMLPSGALIFLRSVEGMLHLDSLYDDGAFTIPPQVRVSA